MEILLDEGGMRVGRLVTGPLDNNVYLLACVRTGAAAIVDAAGDGGGILTAAAPYRVETVLTTHGHADHVGAAGEVSRALGVPVRIHPFDAAAAGLSDPEPLADGERIAVGGLSVEVIHVPGHTPGSVCFLAGTVLFAGDTLFPGGPGATDGRSAFEQIMTGMERRLFPLPDATRVLPGHGEGTTIGAERPSLAEWWARGW